MQPKMPPPRTQRVPRPLTPEEQERLLARDENKRKLAELAASYAPAHDRKTEVVEDTPTEQPKSNNRWDLDEPERTCYECDELIQDDPDGSPGVLVHARSLGDAAFDLDADHVAREDQS